MDVIRSAGLVFGTILLLASNCPKAQGGRHAGARGNGQPGNPNASSKTDKMKDFERGFALQATPDQTSQFQVLSKNTEDAKKQAHDFQHMIETGAKPPEFTDPVDDLKDAVPQAHDGSKEFVEKLCGPQKSGFKNLTKKLAKANSDVARQTAALNQELGRPKADNQKIASAAENLESALTNLRVEQL